MKRPRKYCEGFTCSVCQWLIFAVFLSLGNDHIFQKLQPEVFSKKRFSQKFHKIHGRHLCLSLFLIKLKASVCNIIKKETLAQVFSCAFCEISKSTFFTEHLRAAASDPHSFDILIELIFKQLEVLEIYNKLKDLPDCFLDL